MADILLSSSTLSSLPPVLHQLLGLEEALEMPHLPAAHDQEDACLGQGPPEDPLVGALAGLPEPLLTISEQIILKTKRNHYHQNVLSMTNNSIEICVRWI